MRDVELLGELRRVLAAVDPVPAGVVDAAVTAGGLLGVEWSGFELSEVEVPVLRGRSRGWALGTEFAVFVGERVTGIVGAGLGVERVEMQTPAGSSVFAVDRWGSFEGAALPGRARFVLWRGDGGAMVSSWV
ncbi:hypothetical protein [Actinokineospora bangkokensis]|uniref:Uncharacterized protein n=1 Tax=Actinokineospora bangkokensis TaxID=1193682 RepID=A0A1Q9LFN1_9PSEU|nr:hypothetical protein [Actinokineospora bangkokensis]OLR90779.1 hypothetical protein BJP25_29825 [Actinokineospora bangkokensis]